MIKYFIIVLAALSSSFLFAESVFVDKINSAISTSSIDGSSQSSGEINSAITSLVRASVAQSNSFALTNNRSKADVVLKPSALRLGKAYIFTIDKYRKGQQVYSTNAKATKLGDMDIVVNRVVKSALYEKSVSKTAQVDTVTKEETKGLTTKIKATSQYIFGFGPGFVSNLGSSGDLGFGWMLGGSWGVDHQAAIRLNIEGVHIKDSEAYMFGLFLGMQYYFTKNNNAPYVLGQIGYGSAEADKCTDGFIFKDCESDSGWQLKVGAGYELFRTATVNLGLEAYYAHGLYEVLDKNPAMYGVGVHLLW